MRVHTRTLAIILVALLVALAGCTGGPGDSSEGDAEDDDDDPATESATNESEPSDADTEGELDVADSTGQVGQTTSAFTSNQGQVLQSHAETLSASGSYTAVVTTTWSGSGDDFSSQTGDSIVSTTTTYANPSTGEYYQTTDIPMEDFEYGIESYSPANENVTYTRTNIYGQSTYTKQTHALDTSQHMQPASNSFYESMEFQSQGTVTRNGETLEKYVVTDVEQVNNTAYFGGSLATIDVEVLYNPSRNLMQEVSWTYSYEEESGDSFSSQFRVSYSDIGSTTVQEPSWLSEARQQATGSGSDGGYTTGDFGSIDGDVSNPDGVSLP